MILIEDRTHDKYDTDTIEVWTYNMKLKLKIENSTVKTYDDCYMIVSHTGEYIASFPLNETVFIMKTQETTGQIKQTIED